MPRAVEPADARIRVLLVDDDSIVRAWVRLALADSPFHVAGEASSAAEATALIGRRAADLLLVDYRLPDTLGTAFVQSLRRAGVTVPAVLMTANAERGFNELAREAGAQATVLKTGSVDELLAALRVAAADGTAFDARHPRRPVEQGALTPREREVMRLVAGGATNREVAAALDVKPETVKTLLARAFVKLGARRRGEAVAAARHRGLL